MRVRVVVTVSASLRKVVVVKSSNVMLAYSRVSISIFTWAHRLAYHRSMLGRSRGGQLLYPAAQ